MTVDRARELLSRQVSFGGGYQRQGARLILAEVMRDHGQGAVDSLIRDLRLDETFGFAPGEVFTTPGVSQ